MLEGGGSPEFSQEPTATPVSTPDQTPQTYPGYPLKENPVGKTTPELTPQTPDVPTPAPSPFRKVVGNLSRLMRNSF